MNFYVKLAEFTEIETSRLLLRPMTLADAADMFEYTKNWENLKFIFPPHCSIEETEYAIANHFMKNPLGKWAIELKATQKMIGSISFSKYSEKDAAVEIGYVLNQDFWGQGFMSEALTVLSNFCFYEFGLKRIELLIDKENLSSIRVAEKAGYHFVKSFKASHQYSKVIREFDRYRLP